MSFLSIVSRRNFNLGRVSFAFGGFAFFKSCSRFFSGSGILPDSFLTSNYQQFGLIGGFPLMCKDTCGRMGHRLRALFSRGDTRYPCPYCFVFYRRELSLEHQLSSLY